MVTAFAPWVEKQSRFRGFFNILITITTKILTILKSYFDSRNSAINRFLVNFIPFSFL